MSKHIDHLRGLLDAGTPAFDATTVRVVFAAYDDARASADAAVAQRDALAGAVVAYLAARRNMVNPPRPEGIKRMSARRREFESAVWARASRAARAALDAALARCASPKGGPVADRYDREALGDRDARGEGRGG